MTYHFSSTNIQPSLLVFRLSNDPAHHQERSHLALAPQTSFSFAPSPLYVQGQYIPTYHSYSIRRRSSSSLINRATTSHVFLASKATGGERLIIELSRLNLHIFCPSFKMLDVSKIRNSIPRGAFFTSIFAQQQALFFCHFRTTTSFTVSKLCHSV